VARLGDAWSRLLFVACISLTSACASCDRPRSREARPQPHERTHVAARTTEAASDAPVLTSLARDQLCVTCGSVRATTSGYLSIEDPKVRAIASTMTLPVAELRFVYQGPTSVSAPLRSGIVRRQLGLKLRAHDGCNVLYVMWRIDPTPRLVVSVKRNPGETLSSQCENHGYRDVVPHLVSPLPALVPGSPHVLHAEQHGDQLEVAVDGVAVWVGKLPADALAFDGPVGFRTDNVRVALRLLTVPTGAAPTQARCGGLDSRE
jgi:hypothetical protein